MQVISSELAHDMKAAGFLQKAGQYISETARSGAWDTAEGIEEYDVQIGGREKWAYLPTLSELIEACGDGYLALEHMPKGWIASKTPSKYDNDPEYFGGDEIESGYQHTPEEAVARLWLALNRKEA